MKGTTCKVWLLALALVCMWGLASPAGALEQVSGTKHDFTTLGTTGSGHLCFTCHYPHKTPAQSQLMWNHQLSGNNFGWSDATTTSGGTTYPTNINSWSGSTKLCLSCHDGTVAVGDVMNGTDWDLTIFVTGNRQIATSTGDMRGNHPVAVPYPYNQTANTYNGITTGVNVNLPGFVAAPADVKIFADPTSAGSNRGIECASCHNPHDSSKGKFLRADKGAICQRCHAK